jgi:hypothetical protein
MSELQAWLDTTLKNEDLGMQLVHANGCALEIDPTHFIHEDQFKEKILKVAIETLTSNLYSEIRKKTDGAIVANLPNIISFNLVVQLGKNDSLAEFTFNLDPNAEIMLL